MNCRAQVPIAGCNPLVMGRIMINPAYVTILIYGHYDVMPAENVSVDNLRTVDGGWR